VKTTAFHWEGITFQQSDHLFKIGTDALLLGTWLPKLNIAPKSILDVGTGSGILALLMAKAFPDAAVVAIDIHPAALTLAAQNVSENGFAERVRVMQHDILQEEAEWSHRFDLIVCNPPYYHQQLPSTSVEKNVAMHRDVNSGVWMEALTRARTKTGHLGLVLPSASAFEWIREANRIGWYVCHRLDVFVSETHQSPKRTLLHFTTTLASTQVEQLWMVQSDGELCETYRNWLGI
jgi:tRNA1Val (adenine37-N6)-methyltransferase